MPDRFSDPPADAIAMLEDWLPAHGFEVPEPRLREYPGDRDPGYAVRKPDDWRLKWEVAVVYYNPRKGGPTAARQALNRLGDALEAAGATCTSEWFRGAPRLVVDVRGIRAAQAAGQVEQAMREAAAKNWDTLVGSVPPPDTVSRRSVVV